MPRYAVLENYWNDYYVCIHLMTGTVFGQKMLFFINGLFGLSLGISHFFFSQRVATPFVSHRRFLIQRSLHKSKLQLLVSIRVFVPLFVGCLRILFKVMMS